MYANNELLFPTYIIPILRDQRGPEWRKLIDRVVGLPEDHIEVLAFVLMMIHLNGCIACETDSYRAMRGCGLCAMQTLRRFKGSDQELLASYEKALEDVRRYIARSGRVPSSVSKIA
jgi:hypothetical protein